LQQVAGVRGICLYMPCAPRQIFPFAIYPTRDLRLFRAEYLYDCSPNLLKKCASAEHSQDSSRRAPFLYMAGEDEFESKQKIIGSWRFILKKVKLIVLKVDALMDQLFE